MHPNVIIKYEGGKGSKILNFQRLFLRIGIEKKWSHRFVKQKCHLPFKFIQSML